MAKKKAQKTPTLAVARQVKMYVRSKGFCAAADLSTAVSQKLALLLDSAIARTQSNNRRIVRPADL